MVGTRPPSLFKLRRTLCPPYTPRWLHFSARVAASRAIPDSNVKQPRGHASAFSRRFAPELLHASPSKLKRGRRECRVKASPMARLQQKKQAAVTTGSARSSGTPCAMVFTVCFALSPGTGLSCPRRFVDHPAKLSASVGAPGPHDFTVRLGVVRRRDTRAATPLRPSHPAANVRDDREAPLFKAAGRAEKCS